MRLSTPTLVFSLAGGAWIVAGGVSVAAKEFGRGVLYVAIGAFSVFVGLQKVRVTRRLKSPPGESGDDGAAAAGRGSG